MLRHKLIRNLLIISFLIAVLVPCYEFVFVHPAYNDLITQKTEDEAVRYASYIVRTMGLEGQSLSRENLPDNLAANLKPVARDKQLLKLRIFSANGEIIFSTRADEIGTVNKNDYFHNVVAKGQAYSKVVRSDRRTAEGVVAQGDIVETYVPFMAGTEFCGAFEIYYDVTSSVNHVNALTFLSHLVVILLSAGLLGAIFIALYRVHMSLQERDAAEAALRVVNDGLEQKVSARTRELVGANEQLTEQISERTLAQNALVTALEETRVEREKLDEILRSVPDGVIVADGGLHVLHINSAAEDILGVSLEKILGQSIGKLSTQVDFVREIEQRLNLARSPRPFDIEFLSVAQKDNVYQVRVSPFVSEGMASPGMVMLVRDVTREREIERMKSAFLSMAAHELNTPLTSIIGYAELLTAEDTVDSFDADQKKGFLQLIQDKAMDLGSLIDDLLDISRVESGRPLTLTLREFCFDEKIREIIARYQGKAEGFDFELVLPDEKALIRADQVRLERVVDHLIGNAVKYSPAGGRVEVCLATDDATCKLSVADEGIGMNEEQLAQVFDRFYRTNVSDSAVPGIGLGMNFVRNVVLAHHGEITVESQPGQGTRVCIALPKEPPSDLT